MDLAQLDALCSDLTVAARAFRSLCDSSGNSSPDSNVSVKDPLFLSTNPHDTEHEIAMVRRNLCGITTRLQTLLSGPTCFIRRMAAQNQLLACLKWLGEFQITAYVPLSDSISLDELAELADVPEHTLSRVVRMTATAGFLHEPQLGYVAHTPLSLSFTNELLYFDAAMFLANKVAPSALDLTPFEQKRNNAVWDMTGSQSFESFAAQRAQEPQLNRQWLAYCHSVGSTQNDLGALINLLNWQSLGDASVVHVGDLKRNLIALAHIANGLRVMVQAYDHVPTDSTLTGQEEVEQEPAISHNINIQRRKPTAAQTVSDAAVYILQPCFDARSTDEYAPCELLTLELQSHFEILRKNTSALLILAPKMLPEPGSVALNSEVQARLLDFAEMQFNRKSAVEVTELFKLTESICNAHGRLMVTKRLRSAEGSTIALAVKYQAFGEHSELV
ncbi:O-methyltransferase family [Pyrenophora seminiperda CCB06]|uniref:O-methyltransferase family n=1 Tax=Pyrenophora seminiperda CCB06 TaxID=1302712 RepID=A0A3M7MHB1_9PLEO|nr:O-methyltransferase family [Pyrenophora seminiperda CCB06]